MNGKMTTNAQFLTTEHKEKIQKQRQNKQTTRTGTESQKWRSHAGLSVGKWEEEVGRKGTENKQHKWQVQNRQGEVKNSIGNVEAKELICMIHGHELRRGSAGGIGQRGIYVRKIWNNCNSKINKITLKITKMLIMLSIKFNVQNIPNDAHN